MVMDDMVPKYNREAMDKVIGAIVSSGHTCDCVGTDDTTVSKWCEAFDDCMTCYKAVIERMAEERTANVPEVYVVLKRVKPGEDLYDSQPAEIEDMFDSYEKAVGWVRRQRLTMLPEFCMRDERRELWTYNNDGVSITYDDLPQYMIARYVVN